MTDSEHSLISSRMTLSVVPVADEADLQRSFALRYTVFIDEQGFDPELEVDEHDRAQNTFHFLGKDIEQDKFVATARVVWFEDERKGKIGRVAVLSECRGKNYGVALMRGLETAMKDKCTKFVLSAQLDKVGFYQKCGYERMDDVVYLDEDVEHCMMIKHTVQ